VVTARPVALVTGAGRGIGRGCARSLAERGYDVVVHERSPDEPCEGTLADVAAAGGRSARVHGDIAELDGHAGLVERAGQAFGRLDALVNNAGVSVLARGDLLDASPASWDRCMDVNLRGTFFLTQAFARRLLQDAAGPWHRAIVFVTSCNVEVVSVTRGEYCASKAGLGMVAKLFAVRLAGEGIGVYEVRPGIIRTEMTEPSRAKYDRFFAEGNAPVARWGEPADVGRCVAAMAAGELPYSVGQAVYVDGGIAIPRL
jgi:NAD(P)-dependent dehydrogenase (short-subunit alcohol dehydrogenase family)